MIDVYSRMYAVAPAPLRAWMKNRSIEIDSVAEAATRPMSPWSRRPPPAARETAPASNALDPRKGTRGGLSWEVVGNKLHILTSYNRPLRAIREARYVDPAKSETIEIPISGPTLARLERVLGDMTISAPGGVAVVEELRDQWLALVEPARSEPARPYSMLPSGPSAPRFMADVSPEDNGYGAFIKDRVAAILQNPNPRDIHDVTWRETGSGYIQLDTGDWMFGGGVFGQFGMPVMARMSDGSYAASGCALISITRKGFDENGKKISYHRYYFKAKRAIFAAVGLAELGIVKTAKELAQAYPNGTERYTGDMPCPVRGGLANAVNVSAITDPDDRAAVMETAAVLKKTLRPAKDIALFPYQTIGVAFAARTDYINMFADAPGLGKTSQALACIASDRAELLPAVVVAPSSVFGNWQREIAMWLPGTPVAALGKQKNEIPRGFKGIVVTTWDLLADHLEALVEMGPRYVIADEAHYAKNPDAVRSKALFMLRLETPHVALLTGTPMKNNREELFTLLQLLEMEDWPSIHRFRTQYMQEFKSGRESRFGGVKNSEELIERMRCRVVRRLKEQALDLPPKQRITVEMNLPADARAEYDRANEEFEAWLTSELHRRAAAMGMSADLISDAVAAKIARSMAAEALVKMGQLRGVAARGKVPTAYGLIADLVSRREPVVVFADHLDVLEALGERLAAAGIRFASIVGSTAKSSRSAAVDEFMGQDGAHAAKGKRKRKNPDDEGPTLSAAELRSADALQAGTLDVLLCSQAAKEGITLVRAAHLIFVERFWTPADEEQAEDRIHRIGQTREVKIIRLEARNTIDQRIALILGSKYANIRATVGEGFVTEQTVAGVGILESFILKKNPRRRAAREDDAPPKGRRGFLVRM